MSHMKNTSLLYFGKIASRGDFVRSQNHPQLMASLDSWLSQSMDLMAGDPHWKPVYDSAPAVDFVMLGMNRPIAVAGHLNPSVDTSGRRFPFLTACTLELQEPEKFFTMSALQLESVWERLNEASHKARRADQESVAEVLHALAQTELSYVVESQERRDRFNDFLEMTTVAGFERMLQSAHPDIRLRQTLLAVGLLFQPLIASGVDRVDKGVRLPLPANRQQQMYVASFWISLISSFIKKASFEVTVLLPKGEGRAPAELLMSFNGGASSVLYAALDSRARADVFVDMASAAWIEEHIQVDYGLKKLSSYLQMPQLTLKQARDTFEETFLGS
jgi:type VI secretion system protein ImpM